MRVHPHHRPGRGRARGAVRHDRPGPGLRQHHQGRRYPVRRDAVPEERPGAAPELPRHGRRCCGSGTDDAQRRSSGHRAHPDQRRPGSSDDVRRALLEGVQRPPQRHLHRLERPGAAAAVQGRPHDHGRPDRLLRSGVRREHLGIRRLPLRQLPPARAAARPRRHASGDLRLQHPRRVLLERRLPLVHRRLLLQVPAGRAADELRVHRLVRLGRPHRRRCGERRTSTKVCSPTSSRT